MLEHGVGEPGSSISDHSHLAAEQTLTLLEGRAVDFCAHQVLIQSQKATYNINYRPHSTQKN